MNAWFRLRALILKELQALLGDPHGRKLLIAPIIMQLILFPFAATMEVRNVGVVVLNEDDGVHGEEIMERIASAPTFSSFVVTHGHDEFAARIDDQDALIGLKIAADFSSRIAAGESAALQVVTDGRKSNAAQIATGYVQNIVGSYADELSGAQSVGINVRHFYNPNLEYRWFIVPQLIAIATALGFLIVTALSVAREREQGTLDQLRVSPLSAGQIMTGKALPAIVIALFQGSIVLFAALLIYRVPMHGSLLAIYAGMVCYGLSQVGWGLLISSFCRTQQQAVLGVFAYLVPGLLLSGFISPVENMPGWLQAATWFNPMRHVVDLMNMAYLKGITFAAFADTAVPMLIIAAVSLSLAYFKFRTVSE
ncbi:ABC transporter permease [Steroidobacter sp.]|uniref:ABC transporter permease n=1 Tax=Steroidobacter sp. TaxID=1978227 RepID=UPI001A60CB1D|nr:ABC transporter permease [Steroidobacter sp.]MBL8270925.1 ABC transporter permease [Steroidobacter sp.]